MLDRLGDQLDGARVGGLIQRAHIPLGQRISEQTQAGRIADFLHAGDPDEGGHFAGETLAENHLATERPAFIENNEGGAFFEPGLRRQAPAFDKSAGRIDEFRMTATNGLLEERPVSVIDGGSVF